MNADGSDLFAVDATPVRGAPVGDPRPSYVTVKASPLPELTLKAMPTVLVVWFGKDEHPRRPENRSPLPDVPAFLDLGRGDPPAIWLGQPLWTHRQQHVYEWAIDDVSCSDCRWVAFGPYGDAAAARTAALAIHVELGDDLFRGYRIVNAHCMEFQFKCSPSLYTDG
jgi:hypothetical protein